MRDGTGVRQIGCYTETSLSQLKGLFKVWGSLKCQTLGPPTSLHWLLEEPLVHRAHLDMACEATPGLTDLLCATGTVKLRSVADLAGPRLDASEAVASHLGVRSVRYVRSAVDRWKEALTEHEWALLMDYFAGKETPNATDPFPELSLAPDLTGLERFGSLLDSVGVEEVSFSSAKDDEYITTTVKDPRCILSNSGPNTITGYTGLSVLLPCACSNLQGKPEHVKWTADLGEQSTVLFPEHSTNDQYKQRVQLLNSISPGNVSLHLSHLTLSDGGTYRCEVDRQHRDISLVVIHKFDQLCLKP